MFNMGSVYFVCVFVSEPWIKVGAEYGQGVTAFLLISKYAGCLFIMSCTTAQDEA